MNILNRILIIMIGCLLSNMALAKDLTVGLNQSLAQ